MKTELAEPPKTHGPEGGKVMTAKPACQNICEIKDARVFKEIRQHSAG